MRRTCERKPKKTGENSFEHSTRGEWGSLTLDQLFVVLPVGADALDDLWQVETAGKAERIAEPADGDHSLRCGDRHNFSLVEHWPHHHQPPPPATTTTVPDSWRLS